MKPTFMIVGCGKCGTTTLAHLLDQHPDIFVSKPKEPNFLSYESVYARGWDWYASLFEAGKDKKACGEASVSYSLEEYESKVCARISKYLPDIRVIYIARNPFKRLESVYRGLHDSGYQYRWYLPYNLKAAVDYRPEMVINSLYWQRTEAFRRILPSDRILYLCLEDLQANPPQVLKKCFEFIGVDSLVAIPQENAKLNEGEIKRYDTRLMRYIRTNKLGSYLYGKIPDQIQQALQPLLRKNFGKRNLEWQDSFREEFIQKMRNDVQDFLPLCGHSSDFWGKDFTE